MSVKFLSIQCDVNHTLLKIRHSDKRNSNGKEKYPDCLIKLLLFNTLTKNAGVFSAKL